MFYFFPGARRNTWFKKRNLFLIQKLNYGLLLIKHKSKNKKEKKRKKGSLCGGVLTSWGTVALIQLPTTTPVGGETELDLGDHFPHPGWVPFPHCLKLATPRLRKPFKSIQLKPSVPQYRKLKLFLMWGEVDRDHRTCRWGFENCSGHWRGRGKAGREGCHLRMGHPKVVPGQGLVCKWCIKKCS